MFTSDSEFSLNKYVQITNEVAPQDYYDMLNSAMQNDMWKWFLGYSRNITDVDYDDNPEVSYYKKMNGVRSKEYGPKPKEFYKLDGHLYRTKPEYHSLEINGAWLPEQDLFLHDIYRYLDNIYPDHPDYRILLTNNEANDKIVEAGHVVDYTPDTAYFEYITRAMIGKGEEDEKVAEALKMKIRNLLSNAGRRKLYGSRMGIRAFGGDVLEHTSIFPVGSAITLKQGAELCNDIYQKDIDYYNPNFQKKFKMIDWNQDLSIYKKPENVSFKTRTTSLPGWSSYIIETPALFESELFIDDLTNKMRVVRGKPGVSQFTAEPYGEPLRRAEDYYTDIYEQKWTGYYVNYHRLNRATQPMYHTCYALSINQEIIDSLTDVNRERLLQIYTAKVLPKQESDMGGAMAFNNFFYSIFEDDVPKVLTPFEMGRFVFTQGQIFLKPKYMLQGYQGDMLTFDKDGNVNRKDHTPFWSSNLPIKQDQFFMLQYPWRTTTDKMAAYAFNDFNKGHIQFANIQKYQKSADKIDPRAAYVAIVKTVKNERVALIGYADGELTAHGLNTELRSFRFDIVSIPEKTNLMVNDDTNVLHLMYPELIELENDLLQTNDEALKEQLQEKVNKIRADKENRIKLLLNDNDWSLQVSQSDLLYLYKVKGLFIEPVELDSKRCFIEFLDMGTISVLPVMTYNYWEFVPKFIHHFENGDDSKTIKWNTFTNNINNSKIDFPYCDLSDYRKNRTDYNTPAPGYITDNANDLLLSIDNDTSLETIPYTLHEILGVVDIEQNDGDINHVITVDDQVSLNKLRTLSIGDIVSGPGVPPDTYIKEITGNQIILSDALQESGQYKFYVECKFDIVPLSTDGDFLSYKQDQYKMGNYNRRSVWAEHGGVWPSPNWPRTAENSYLNGLLDFTFFEVNNKFNAFEDVLHYIYKGYFEKNDIPNDGIISSAHIKHESDLWVEYNIKQILHMPNRLNVDETLCNVEVLDYLDRNTRYFSRAADKTNIGVQLLINTDISGVYSLLDGEEYTDPSIKLKAQTYNWTPDTIPYYAGIGVGGSQSMFNTFVHMLSSVYDVAMYDGNYEDFYEKYTLAKEDGLLLTRRHTYQGTFTFDDLGFDYYDSLDKPKYEVELCEYDINHKFTPDDATNALYSCIQANFIKRSFDNLRLETKLNLNDKEFFINKLIKENDENTPAYINYLDKNFTHKYCGDIVLNTGKDGYVNYPSIYDEKDGTQLYDVGDYFVITAPSIINCVAPDKYNFFGLESYETKAPSLLVLARDINDDTLYWKYCEFQFDGTWGFIKDNISNVPLNEGDTNTVWDQFNNVLDSEANWLKTIEKYHKNVDLASMLLYKHLASNLMLSSQAQDLYFRFTQADFFENTKTINIVDENDELKVPEEFAFLMHDPAKSTDPEHGFDITDIDHKIFTFLYTGNEKVGDEVFKSGYELGEWAKPGDLICLYMYQDKEDRKQKHHKYVYDNTTEEIEYDDLGHFTDFVMYEDVSTKWRCSLFVIPYTHAIAFGIPLDIPAGVLDSERIEIQHNKDYSPYVLKDNYFSKTKLPHKVIAKGSDVLKYILDPKFTAFGKYIEDGKISDEELEFYVSSNKISYNDTLDVFTTISCGVEDNVEREFIIKFNETKYFKNLLRFNCEYTTAKILEDDEIKQYGAIRPLTTNDFPVYKLSSNDILVKAEEIFERSEYNNAFESLMFTSDEKIATSVYGVDKAGRTVLTAKRDSNDPYSNNAMFGGFIRNIMPKANIFKIAEETGYTEYDKLEGNMPSVTYSKVSTPVSGGDFHEKTPEIDIENQVIRYYKNALILEGSISQFDPYSIKVDETQALNYIKKDDTVLSIAVDPPIEQSAYINLMHRWFGSILSAVKAKNIFVIKYCLGGSTESTEHHHHGEHHHDGAEWDNKLRLGFFNCDDIRDGVQNDVSILHEIDCTSTFDITRYNLCGAYYVNNDLYASLSLDDNDDETSEHSIVIKVDVDNLTCSKVDFDFNEYEKASSHFIIQDDIILNNNDIQQTFVKDASGNLVYKPVIKQYDNKNKFISFKDDKFGFILDNNKVQIFSKKYKYKYNEYTEKYDKSGFSDKSYFTYAELPTSEAHLREQLGSVENAKKIFEKVCADIKSKWQTLRDEYLTYAYDSIITDMKATSSNFNGTFIKESETNKIFTFDKGIVTTSDINNDDFASVAFTEVGPKTIGFGALDLKPFASTILKKNNSLIATSDVETQFNIITFGEIRNNKTQVKYWKPTFDKQYYLYNSSQRDLMKKPAWLWEEDNKQYVSYIDISDIDNFNINNVTTIDVTNYRKDETEHGFVFSSTKDKIEIYESYGFCLSSIILKYDAKNTAPSFNDKLMKVEDEWFPKDWDYDKILKYRAYTNMHKWVVSLPDGYISKDKDRYVLPNAEWVNANLESVNAVQDARYAKIKPHSNASLGFGIDEADWYYYALYYILGYKEENDLFTDSVVDIIYTKDNVIFLCYDGRAFAIPYECCYSRDDFENPENWIKLDTEGCYIETPLSNAAFKPKHHIVDSNGHSIQVELSSKSYKRVAIFHNVFQKQDLLILSGRKLSRETIIKYKGYTDFISDEKAYVLANNESVTINNNTYEKASDYIGNALNFGTLASQSCPFVCYADDSLNLQYSSFNEIESLQKLDVSVEYRASYPALNGGKIYISPSDKNGLVHYLPIGEQLIYTLYNFIVKTFEISANYKVQNIYDIDSESPPDEVENLHCYKDVDSLSIPMDLFFMSGMEHNRRIKVKTPMSFIKLNANISYATNNAIVLDLDIFKEIPARNYKALISVVPNNYQIETPTYFLQNFNEDYLKDGKLIVPTCIEVFSENNADRAYIQNEWLARQDFDRSLVRGTNVLVQEDITKYPSSFYDKAPIIASSIKKSFDDDYDGDYQENATRGQFYSYDVDIREMTRHAALKVEPKPIRNSINKQVLLCNEDGSMILQKQDDKYIAGTYYDAITSQGFVACPKPTLSITEYARLSYQDSIDRNLTEKLKDILHISESAFNVSLPFMTVDKDLGIDLDAYGFSESEIDDFIEYLKVLGLNPTVCINKHDLTNDKYRFIVKDGMIYDQTLKVWPINVVKIYELILAIPYDYIKGSQVIYNALPTLQGHNVLAPNGNNIVGIAFNKQGYGGYAGNRDWFELPWQVDKKAFETCYAYNSANQPIKLYNDDGTVWESSNADRLYDVDDENIVYAEDYKGNCHDIIDNDSGVTYHLWLEAEPSNVTYVSAAKYLYHKKNTAKHCIGQVVFYDERGQLPKELYKVIFDIDPKNATQWDHTEFEYDYETGFVYANTSKSKVSTKNTITLRCVARYDETIEYLAVEIDSYEKETLPTYVSDILYSFNDVPETTEDVQQIVIKLPNELEVLRQITKNGEAYRYDEYLDENGGMTFGIGSSTIKYPFAYAISGKITRVCVIDGKPLTYYIEEPETKWIGVEHLDFKTYDGSYTYTVQRGVGTKVLSDNGRSLTGLYGYSYIRMPKYASFKELVDKEGHEIVARELSGERLKDPTNADLGLLAEVNHDKKMAMFDGTIKLPYVNDGRVYALRLTFLTINDIKLTSEQMNDPDLFMHVPNNLIEKYSPNRVYFEKNGYPQPPIEFEGIGHNLENTRYYNGQFFYNADDAKIFKSDSEGRMIVLSVDEGKVLETALQKGEKYSEYNVFYVPSPIHKTCYDWYKNGFYVMNTNQNPFWQILKVHSVFNNKNKTYDVIYDTLEMYKSGGLLRYTTVEDEKRYAKIHVVSQINLVNGANYTSSEIINYAKGIVNLAVERYGSWYTWHDVVTNYGIAGKVNFNEKTTKIDATLLAKYCTCTTENFANKLDTESGIVQISEFGLFDKDHNLIMYSTFPPIEYRSDKQHLSVVSFINLEHNYKL